MARDEGCAAATPMPFDHLFRTKRLLFRALENTPEHSAFIRDIMIEDPATYAQSTNRLLAPLTADEVESDVAGLVKSAFLAVVIYLRPVRPLAPAPAPAPSSSPMTDKGEQDPTMSNMATAIGWLTLDCHALTLHHRSCTLGIMIGSAYQGKGYGTEAITWALDWAFRVAAMHAVRLSCWSFNERAAALYRRLGFVQEGITREAYYYDGVWYDRVLFSILDREWAALRACRSRRG